MSNATPSGRPDWEHRSGRSRVPRIDFAATRQSLTSATAQALSTLAARSRRIHLVGAQFFLRHSLLRQPLEVVDPALNAYPFFEHNILFHTHVQKSAGTTLVEFLKILLGTNRIHDLRDPLVADPSCLEPQDRGAICVLTGHFHYGLMDRFFSRNPRYIASVRHPVARFFSYYKFVSSRPDHPDYGDVAGRTFDQVVAEYATTRHNAINNPMSRTVTGQRAPSPDETIDHVKHKYFLVTPQHGIDKLIYAFSHAFGKSREAVMPPTNVGHYSDAPSDQARDMILKMNQVDLALYEYVCREFPHSLDRVAREIRG